FSLRGPQRSHPLALIAFELVAHPEQRAIDRGAVVAGQFDDPGLDDETAEFDEVPRPLAALDLPCAHVSPRPCCPMTVVGRPVAPERPQRHGQVPEQIAATGPERKWPRVWTMPPSFRRPSSRPARSARPPAHWR